MAIRLPVFTKRAKRETIQHPKFFFFDTGVYRAIRPLGPLDAPEEIDGAALETLFLQESRALNNYLDLGYEHFYWRTKNKLEVDFVLYGERGLYAFEIKRSAQLRGADLSGLKQFLLDYPQAHTYCFYGGTKEYNDGNIHILPFSTALQRLGKIIGG